MSLHYLSLVPLRQAPSVNLPAFVTRSLTQYIEQSNLNFICYRADLLCSRRVCGMGWRCSSCMRRQSGEMSPAWSGSWGSCWPADLCADLSFGCCFLFTTCVTTTTDDNPGSWVCFLSRLEGNYEWVQARRFTFVPAGWWLPVCRVVTLATTWGLTRGQGLTKIPSATQCCFHLSFISWLSLSLLIKFLYLSRYNC